MEGVRRRKPGDSDRTTLVKSDLKLSNTSWRKQCAYLSLLVLAALSGGLLYAYFTSPTSSVSIRDTHDVAKLKWAYQRNGDLEKGSRILEELYGPESIATDGNGNWYTGLEDGRIVKVADADKPEPSITDITAFANFSAGGTRAKKRPLGLRVVKSQLYVVDAYQGLFVIDLETKTWDKIVGYNDVTPQMMFPDDLTISKDGNTIYFTDASKRWMYYEPAFSVAEGECTGRVFRVMLSTKHVQLVRDGLCFANGVQLSPDETALLVAEMTRNRILVLDPDSGRTTKTILLHGGPDNIRPRISGGYWVAIPLFVHPVIKYFDRYPALRDIFSKVFGLHGILKLLIFNHGTIVRLNEKFDVVGGYYDTEGKVCFAITEVHEFDKDQLFLGTFAAHGIVKAKAPSRS